MQARHSGKRGSRWQVGQVRQARHVAAESHVAQTGVYGTSCVTPQV